MEWVPQYLIGRSQESLFISGTAESPETWIQTRVSRNPYIPSNAMQDFQKSGQSPVWQIRVSSNELWDEREGKEFLQEFSKCAVVFFSLGNCLILTLNQASIQEINLKSWIHVELAVSIKTGMRHHRYRASLRWQRERESRSKSAAALEINCISSNSRSRIHEYFCRRNASNWV